VARMPPRANTEAAKEQEIIAARSPLFATAPSGAFFMEIGVTTSTTCRQCGERFQVKPRAGRDTYRRRKPGDPTYPLARYCSSGCKQAAYRRRSAVTNTPVGTTAFSAVTSPSRHIENTNEFLSKKTVLGRREERLTFWRWYERLDGSYDLYRDTETDMCHVARIVRRDGRYQLVKPAHLTSAVWTDRLAAQRAVRGLIKKAA